MIGSLRGFESGTAGNAEDVDCQTRAVYAFSLLSLPLSDNRIISNDVGMVVNKENDDIGAIRSLAAPPSHSTPFVRAPHLHSFLPIPHLTTLTAVAGIHTDTALRWITGNLLARPFTAVAIPVTHRTRGSGTGDGASECAGHEQMDCDITHVCFSVGR